MSKRNLFVSFAESDGGHSYLAARTMLDPGSIAHLIFRTSVADSLDAVAAGQANYAVVPAYNSITQWEGATLKALASGQFEIYAQVCMPTSYVLVAHKDYMHEFVSAYLHLREPTLEPTQEDAAKIYTRFLSRIFVGAQADEQYRGRLVRPDLKHATVELSRNPLRILEEMSRTELLKALNAPNARYAGYGGGYGLPPNQSGGTIDIGATAVLSKQSQQVGAIPLMETLEAPAALVAAGLLDAPGDPEGWDQPGSLGEIVALLRKLLVLLNVYSFGSPDLPENKTQYLLIGRRDQSPEALRAPQAAPTRIMTLVRPSLKKASADQWLKPRAQLSARVKPHHFVFDRPPLMLSLGNAPVFLFEGGKPKDGIMQSPVGWLEAAGRWVAEALVPSDARDKSAAKAKEKSLRKAIEGKETRAYWTDQPERLDAVFLGQYQTWCPETPGNSCWCCEEAHAEKGGDPGPNQLVQFLLAGLVALTMLALIILPVYCAMTGACNWFGDSPKLEILPAPQTGPPPSPAQPATPPATRPAYPGSDETKPAPAKPEIIAPAPPKAEAPKAPSVFNVAFAPAKANLEPRAMNVLSSAAATALHMHRTATLHIEALGARENDRELWQRRIFAVKDELVRLGVPSSRIRIEGSGPYVVTIRANQPPRSDGTRRRINDDLESVPDPLGGDY